MSKEIRKPMTRKLWVARTNDGSILHVGKTNPDQVTTTGQPILDEFDDEPSLVTSLGRWAERFPELPRAGEQLEEGEIYRVGADVVMVRERHQRRDEPPASTRFWTKDG